MRIVAATLMLFLAIVTVAWGQDAPPSPPPLDAGAAERLLSRMTDADLRSFLAQELAAGQAGAAATTMAPMAPGALGAALERVQSQALLAVERLAQWVTETAAIADRLPDVRQRLGEARFGVAGMAAACLALAAAGLGAAALLARFAAPLRRALATPAAKASLGERLARAALLCAVDLAGMALFVATTVTVAPLLRPAMGPMWDYVWIWHAGLSAGWGALAIGRRLFAADLPSLRVAALDAPTAAALDLTLARCVRIGVGGWLLAGLSPTLGFGIGPAILTVLTAGAGVAAVALAQTLRRRDTIRAAAGALLGVAPDAPRGAPAAVAAAAAPWGLVAFILLSWAFWAMVWLATGELRLAGPFGTVALLFVLPVLDRIGAETAMLLTRTMESGREMRDALQGGWRIVLGFGGAFAAAGAWGVDAPELIWGPGAPRWFGAAADLVLTLSAAIVLWRLIIAAIPPAPAFAAATDGDEGGAVGPDARRHTLTPLLRGALKALLVSVAAMSALTSLGVDVGPLIASAGVVGIAIGFGAQTLVRDVFSGIFFLVDDAFRVGEYIEFDKDLKGQVEAISVRSLRLRHHLGPIITVPFGELRSVTNHSRDWVIWRLDFRMEPDTDPAKVKKIVKGVAAELLADPDHGPKLLEPPKSQGVFMVDDDSALVMRIKFKCRPGAQWVLRRETYQRLTRDFAAQGVRIARRKVEVVGAATPEAAAAAVAAEPVAAA